MAIDNLNYYSSWLPAGQQTDKYSSQPWCLKSKNLDIFSSSKSVKSTAWSAPVNMDLSGVVLTDQTGNLIFKNDDKVYDISSGNEVLVFSGVAANFPVYKVSYNGKIWTYNDMQRWTPKQLISKYENWTLKYFTIFTDRARFSYSTVKYDVEADLSSESRVQNSLWRFEKDSSAKSTHIDLELPDARWFSNITLNIQATNSNYSTEWTLTISSLSYTKPKYWYNAEISGMEWIFWSYENLPITDQLDVPTSKTAHIDIPMSPDRWTTFLEIWFTVNPPSWSTDYTWSAWEVDISVSGYNYYYNYLSIDDSRYLKDIWEYYREKWETFQTLYNFTYDYTNDDNYYRVRRYSLDKYIWWDNDISMNVIGMIVWNEQVYMIGNMNWNGYIIPCDLSWGKWTPYIAYWCAFSWVTNIDYLLYLVGTDRDICQLWVFNNQELVPILWGNEEQQAQNLIKTDEQYNFDGRIVEYRGNLVLSTSDGRIFEYGQTYWGKWGSFIHELPAWAVITNLTAKDNDLTVRYSITANDTTTNYSITYQDDVPIKNYNLEWSAVYPIVLGNHMLEKEESDLYTSFILPSSATSLEFWGMANHYHFRTFTSADNATLSISESYKMKWASGTYALKFIERDGDQYTFRLEWDLPVQANSEMKVIDSNNTVVLNYSDFNHFRKIWEIETDTYLEWEFRFHNLNNKLELPKSHSLQIMVKGKGTANYTPELFSLDLVANQRERW